jgi:polyvinyl alcohol dehydrogenase (cytochrome)
MKIRIAASLSVLSLVATVAALGIARADGACAAAAAGGDWLSYGHDVSNTRTQSDEHVIDATKAAALAPAWVLPLDAAGIGGDQQATPVVSDGCVFVTTTDGWVGAFNADTGALAWKVRLPIAHGGYAGRIVGSVAVDDGHVYVIGNEAGNPDANAGPYLASLALSSGDIEWTTIVDTRTDNFSNASPVVFGNFVFVGIAGPESSPRARGGYALVDKRDGSLVVKRYAINDVDFAKGYAGASIWSTPAVDTAHGYLYVGSGNPASKKIEHAFANALLKIDVDPARASFGDIVAAFKGNADSYSQTIANQPACDLVGDRPEAQYVGVWSAPCGQLDLDFGASPNLFKDATGRLLLGDLQKSGVYHVIDADTMTNLYDLPVGPPCFACNAASGATVGDKIFTAAVPPGQIVSIDGSQGLYRWVAPIADGLHYESLSTANGVVYTLDTGSYLDAYDAETGRLLLKRSLVADAGGDSTPAVNLASAGVAIARNTVYAGIGSLLIAYR